jgi:hypothetical protein
MIEDYADLLKLIKEKVQPSPFDNSPIRVLPNTLVTRLCLALSEAESLSKSWDKQSKSIAELEARLDKETEVIWQQQEVVGEDCSGTWMGLDGDVNGDSFVLWDNEGEPAICLRTPIFQQPPKEQGQ